MGTKMDRISESLREHYKKTFQKHGATVKGVDWGESEANLHLRYDKMLAVIEKGSAEKPSVLDVGCGYGGLLDYMIKKGINLQYTGIDVEENMVIWAQNAHPEATFIRGDILEVRIDKQFDYVVCNGILTQKLDVQGLVMDEYAGKLIRTMFALCSKGLAFNVMTTKVNFFSNNLYYRNPAELLSWCLTEITTHIKLDHAYHLYEYTVYLYR